MASPRRSPAKHQPAQPHGSPGPTNHASSQDGEAGTLLANQPSKYQSLKVRTISTVVLIGSFVFIIYLGHVPLMLMILAIQVTMIRELFILARMGQKPGSRSLESLQWYFFGVAAFWMYFRFIKKNLLVEITSSQELAMVFGWILRRHSFLSYALYTAGFVAFVLKLEKTQYLYQFGQFAWTHMILLCVFIPSSFFVSNIFDGLIWFLLPTCLVIINDIAAYLAGFFFGRTPLIRLSPKKTWEGFIGGFLLTMIASWYLSGILSQFKWMTCERTDLSLGWLDCEPDDIYQRREFSISELPHLLPMSTKEFLHNVTSEIPLNIRELVIEPASRFTFTARPMQVHAVVLAAFAAVIAPFGGFFASGFKRGFKIKDFGHSIPGHGGMTDRMDCQVVMASFSYLYFNNYVAKQGVTVGTVLATVMRLDTHAQLELFERLGNVLAAEDALPEYLVKGVRMFHKARLRHHPLR